MFASALRTVLEAELGAASMPVWGTSSPTADGARRRFTSTGALVQEVGDARVWGGIHYRNATDVGARRGREVGELAAPWLGAAL